jgi:hypothetical protein
MSAVELRMDRLQLPLLELADGQPRHRSAAHDGRVHELQDRPLVKRVGDDLGPAPSSPNSRSRRFVSGMKAEGAISGDIPVWP